MKLPKMPWYTALNQKLEGAEWLVNALLVGIIIASIVLLIRGDRLTKTAWFIYLISP